MIIHKARNSYLTLNSLYWLISSLTFPVLTIHLLGLGINYIDLGLIVSFSTLAYLALDIPVGFVGDVFKKKYVFIIGMVFHASGYFLWAIAKDLQTIVSGYILWNIGRSFFSGILESWYVNSIENDNERASIINKTFNIASMISSFSIGVGVLVTSQLLLFKNNDILLFEANSILKITSVLFLFLSILAYFLMSDNKKYAAKPLIIGLYSKKEIITSLKSLKFIRFLPLSFSYGFAFGFFEIFWMPIGKSFGIEDFKISLAYSSAYFLSTLSLIILLKKNFVPKKYNFWICYLRFAFSASFIIMSHSYSFPVFLISIIAIYVISFIEYPIIQTAIHQSIPDKYRNVMLSIESVVKQASGLVSGGIGGWLYQHYGAKTSLISIFVIGLLSIIIYSIITNIMQKSACNGFKK